MIGVALGVNTEFHANRLRQLEVSDLALRLSRRRVSVVAEALSVHVANYTDDLTEAVDEL